MYELLPVLPQKDGGKCLSKQKKNINDKQILKGISKMCLFIKFRYENEMKIYVASCKGF